MSRLPPGDLCFLAAFGGLPLLFVGVYVSWLVCAAGATLVLVGGVGAGYARKR